MPDALTLGWVIVYVDDPPAAAAYYTDTFGIPGRFVADSGDYAELDTGSTKLAFASYTLGEQNFEGGVRHAQPDAPANVELALVTEDVDGAYERALKAGCTGHAPPADKPQGQRVGWIQDPFGTLIELATPL